MIKQKVKSIYKRLIIGLMSNSSTHLENRWNISDCQEFEGFRKCLDCSVTYRVDTIKLDKTKEKHKWVGAQINNGTVFAIPNDETLVLCYGTNGCNYIEGIKKGLFKWTGGCVWNNSIYCFPRTSNSFLKISEEGVKEIPLSTEYNGEHHYSGVCTRAGIVYQPPRNTNHILKTDLRTGLSNRIDIVDKKYKVNFRYCGSIIHPNGFIYFFPESGRVIKFNPVTDKWCFIGKNLSTMCFDAKVGMDGNIYGYSAYCKGIMKIDVSSDVVEMIHQEITPGAYGTKYGLDGCLYSVPGDGSCIWKYDVILDTIYMMYNLEDDSKAKYAGGLTLPNGEIVFVPATSSTIMVLKPERYMRIPESFYKAFCQDNY